MTPLQETWAWLEQQAASRPGGVVYVAFGTEVGAGQAPNACTSLAWLMLLFLPFLYVPQVLPSKETFSKLMAGVRSFCSTHKAASLLALRPIVRKHLTEAAFSTNVLGPDIKLVEWVRQVGAGRVMDVHSSTQA